MWLGRVGWWRISVAVVVVNSGDGHVAPISSRQIGLPSGIGEGTRLGAAVVALSMSTWIVADVPDSIEVPDRYLLALLRLAGTKVEREMLRLSSLLSLRAI